MKEESESTIEKLVRKATEDSDLTGFLEAMLDSSRSIANVMTLRLVDLLLSEEETGASLKWLVWADPSAMQSDLHRMKDYRRRTTHQTNEFLLDFLAVWGSIFHTDDPQVTILSTMEMQDSQENQSDIRKERIDEINKRMDNLSKDKAWMKDFIEGLMSYILSIVKSGMLMDFFVESPISQLKNLLSASGLQHLEYTQSLDTLVNFELVSSQFTLFWCDECDPVPRTLVAPYIERPSKLEMNCPKCRTPMNIVSIIEPCDEVMEWLNSKDGLLSIIVGYILESNELDWHANVAEEREIDFLVEKEEFEIVMEVKVHKIYSDREQEALTSTLNNDLCQLANTCNMLSKKRSKQIVGILIWNQDVDTDIADKVLQGEAVAKRFDSENLIVVSLNGLENLADNLLKFP